MHALKRFGTAFGGYKMMENYPVPECGPDDIILEIKAAAICGADMKHWGVDNGSMTQTSLPISSSRFVVMSSQAKSLRSVKM